MVSFEPSSIYGSRVGFHEILLVTAADKHNIFHRSALWKQLVVQGVSMLSRSSMAKPPRGDNTFGGEPRFTRVQEMKQAGFKLPPKKQTEARKQITFSRSPALCLDTNLFLFISIGIVASTAVAAASLPRSTKP